MVKHPASGWRNHYDANNVSAQEAVALVRQGDHIYIPAPAGPRTANMVLALLPRLEELAPITISALPAFDLSWYTEEMAKLVNIHVMFAAPNSRGVVNDHRADFRPWMVWAGHRAANEGRPGARALDVAMVAVSPPNAHGYCCFGASLWDQKKVALEARLTLAAVDATMPATFGDTWIHVSDIDKFVAVDPFRPPDLPVPVVETWEPAIAANVRELIRDGDTVQFGLGSTTAAVVREGALNAREDLAYWGELTVPGIVDLVKAGVITGERSRTHPNTFIATSAGNSSMDLEFIAGNPRFEFYPPDYVHNPKVISANDNMVAINNALAVDLTGQIAAGEFGYRTWSGTGGQFAFAMGAFMSEGGRSITVLPATAVGGTKSRIVGQFEPGQIVTVPRDIADFVVTEYGVASLINKSQRERVDEMISIAHPDFRADLRKHADNWFGR